MHIHNFSERVHVNVNVLIDVDSCGLSHKSRHLSTQSCTSERPFLEMCRLLVYVHSKLSRYMCSDLMARSEPSHLTGCDDKLHVKPRG